jgi:hypothetical protein
MSAEEKPQTVKEKTYRLTCITCGRPIKVRKIEGDELEWLPHYDCDAPMFRIKYPEAKP